MGLLGRLYVGGREAREGRLLGPLPCPIVRLWNTASDRSRNLPAFRPNRAVARSGLEIRESVWRIRTAAAPLSSSGGRPNRARRIRRRMASRARRVPDCIPALAGDRLGRQKELARGVRAVPGIPPRWLACRLQAP